MRVKLDKGAKMPTRAHDSDAGFDLYARELKLVPAHGSVVFDTGVHIQIPYGFAGFIKSKSGLNINHGIISDGLVDSGYTGSIRVKLYNLSDVPYVVCEGDKISQIAIEPVLMDSLELFDGDFEETERGNGGFGSTGR